MAQLPTLESQPIGNYGESVMQFRMPTGWQVDYQAYLRQWAIDHPETNKRTT